MYLLHNCRTNITFEEISEKFLKQEFHMHQLNSCQMGKFEKITIQGIDVKFSSFDMALENWQTAQMPPGKSPKIISLWPGIICFCKMMINDRTFFSSDHLENIT